MYLIYIRSGTPCVLELFKKYIALILVTATLFSRVAEGQILSRYDSVKLEQVHFTHNKFINNIFHQAMNSVKKGDDDNMDIADFMNGKSEDAYLPFQGKIIRKININVFNFDRSFDDTMKQDNSLPSRIGKRLHYTTKHFVVEDNLFIKENTPLNAYKLADNERYLRTLEYIQDARIIASAIPNNPDSVDIYIYTKDFFSIAGGASSQIFNHINLDVYETNLGGMAQRLEFTGLYDYNRSPNGGFGALYRKGNVSHTFIDATVAYSTMSGSSYTGEEETATYLSLTKRLVSPYTRTAGGLLLSHNETHNIYNLQDNVFFRYKYNLLDAWAGYSIGIKQLTATNNTIRDRRFLSFRYIDRNFTQVPTQVGATFNPLFNSSQIGLAQLTFYRQDYRKTYYVYGFGTTEDIPYGYNISLVGGLQRQLDLQRPYGGLMATQYIATEKGGFVKLFLRTGGFLYQNKLQDGSVLAGASVISRLYLWNNTRIRYFVTGSYTHLYNRVTYAPLRIDNSYGLRGYLSDSTYGTSRFSLQMETEFYLRGQILGFRFAPFPYADLALITPENKPFSASSLHTSVGGGIRARNPNLVFETIELRAYFFPAAPDNMRGFKVIVTSNIKFRYTSNYVTPPDVVQLNSD